MGVIEEKSGQKYSVWQALALSFFSKDLYADVGGKWKGVGYAYLFLVIVLLSIPRAVSFQLGITMPTDFVKNIPDFKLEKGLFSSAVKQPYRFLYDGGGIIIDTTGKIESLAQVPDVEKTQNFILVNKTKMTIHRIRFGTVEDKVYDFAKLTSFSVDQEKLDRWAKAIIRWSGTVFYFVMVVSWFLGGAVVLLFYGLFGLLFAEMLKKKVDYNAALRLSVVSHFPAMILSSILMISSVLFPWHFLWTFLLSTAYLFFAVSSQETPEPSKV